MKIERMLTIVVILLNRKRITAKELAEKFEVSVRTIYRDIESINMAGIPIISYAGNHGGYGIMDHYKLSNQLLTTGNLFSMLSALCNMNDTFEDQELESSIEKLKNLVPRDQNRQLDLHMEQVIIDTPHGTYTDQQKQKIKSIRLAIAHSQLMTMTYRNYGNEVTSRQVEPMSLIFKGYTWYLFAYCRLKEDYRVFRVSRIRDLHVENSLFARRNKTYHEVETLSPKDEARVTVKLKFDAHIRSRVEDIFPDHQIEVLENGDLLVTTNFPDKEWYMTLLLSFGEHVEVISPEFVRQTMISRIQSMQKKYS